ncbi:hypothetical protein B0T21DRAFT_409487 [Apiosordaria backusii]|uniref:CHY-type domain-containing protein n=1 Tax=Apiosordaria backusii TaxID=314023 RepID=A0AA40BRT2_9PEZI|nr:hypothetical protein B0T21DRAFT_409487 [Apiosordaria backusii]
MIPIRPKPNDDASTSARGPQAVTTAPPSSRVVPKPIPAQQKQDTRTYQINQLKRRYPSHKETPLPGGENSLSFNLVPSDPDFPFDLDHLECELHIPAKYPKQPPKLHVKNQNIPRGFAINIEKGWDKLVVERTANGGTTTLLSLTNGLDKKLESLLSEEKAETVKLTIFKDTRHLDQQQAQEKEKEAVVVSNPAPTPAPQVKRSYIPLETFTQSQIAQAKARRAQEVRQLEARMGRLPHYHRSSDGIIYTLPLEPKKRAELPSQLQGIKSVQLVVPLLYPLQNLRVLLNDVEGGQEGEELAEGVEELFTKKAGELKKEGDKEEKMGLVAMVNWLAQRVHLLAREVVREREKKRKEMEEGKGKVVEVEVKEAEHAASVTTAAQVDRGHLHVIPRPPEWGFDDVESESSEYNSEDEDDEGGAEIGEDTGGSSVPTQTVERGTAMSFPSIELHGIELLQVSILSLSVKCDRCKTLNEVTGLKNNLEKASSCKKCATAFTVRYRQELVHMNSTRAGFIDASGCTVADLLPSTFVPTCGKCSHPSLGLVSVRGETTTNICRECHARFTFKIPDVKFLDYAPGMHTRLPPTSGPRRKTEKLGLHAGEPLPEKGSCQHYKKSYRWFRFSCCSKVYPCDKCHDAAEEHINEWANRMICGWCSREQNYSVESCAFCGRSVIGKRGSGFWEGGKGTRDKRLMRRGDKRKYRRGGGGEARKD